MNKLDKILLIDCIILLVYTATVLAGWFMSQTEPSTLTVAFFSAFGMEVVLTAAIKISNNVTEDKTDVHD